MKRTKRILFVLLGIVLLFGILFMIVIQPNKRNKLSVPVQHLPSPNAYDDFLAASQMITDKNDIIHFDLTLPEAHKLLDKNKSVIALLQKGLSHEFCYPHRPCIDGKAFSNDAILMAQLLRIKIAVKTYEHKDQTAIYDALDFLQFGTKICHESPLNVCSSSLHIQLFGMKCIAENFLGHLTRDKTQIAIMRMRQICDDQVNCAECIQNIKWNVLVNYNYVINMPQYHRLTSVKERIAKMYMQYCDYLDTMCNMVNKPYYLQGHIQQPPTPVGTVLCSADLQALPLKLLRCQTHARLLLVALALREYQFDNNKFPSNLGELVPKYLNNIPDDPFLINGKLHYNIYKNTYILYSVGPDGHDDHGMAIYDQNAETIDLRRQVTATSKGDFVITKNW